LAFQRGSASSDAASLVENTRTAARAPGGARRHWTGCEPRPSERVHSFYQRPVLAVALRTAVVGARERVKLLLARRVPQLQPHGAPERVHAQRLLQEVHADGLLVRV
jgi:hypothetical protein